MDGIHNPSSRAEARLEAEIAAGATATAHAIGQIACFVGFRGRGTSCLCHRSCLVAAHRDRADPPVLPSGNVRDPHANDRVGERGPLPVSAGC